MGPLRRQRSSGLTGARPVTTLGRLGLWGRSGSGRFACRPGGLPSLVRVERACAQWLDHAPSQRGEWQRTAESYHRANRCGRAVLSRTEGSDMPAVTLERGKRSRSVCPGRAYPP